MTAGRGSMMVWCRHSRFGHSVPLPPPMFPDACHISGSAKILCIMFSLHVLLTTHLCHSFGRLATTEKKDYWRMRAENKPVPGPGNQPPHSSTLPYLLRGLGAVVGLIAFAFIVLACSFRHSRNRNDASLPPPHPPDKPPKPHVLPPPDVDEPKIVVVMAGDVEPTFLAKPISRPPRD